MNAVQESAACENWRNGSCGVEPCLEVCRPASALQGRGADRITYDALRQIIALAEYATTGPTTVPPCKSDKMTAQQATSLRGAISTIARQALSALEHDSPTLRPEPRQENDDGRDNETPRRLRSRQPQC